MQTLFPTMFSSSMLEDLWGCPLAWFRKYCQKLSFDGGYGNPDLITGGLLASALEITRKAYYNDNLTQAEAVELGKISILEGQDTGHIIKTNEKLAEVFVAYFRKFPLNTGLQPIELINNTFAIEYKFELDLGISHPELDRNLVFTGKLDFLGEKWYNGKLRRFVVDDKTCSSVNFYTGTKDPDIDKEKEEYQLRGQFNAYLWAIKILETQLNISINCDGVIVRRVPILKDFVPSFEILISISNFQVSAWEAATISKIIEMKELYSSFKDSKSKDFRKFFPPVYGTACTKWGKQVNYKMGESHNFQKSCQFALGCINKDGDDIIIANSLQEVGYPEVPLERGRISFKQYLTEINK